MLDYVVLGLFVLSTIFLILNEVFKVGGKKFFIITFGTMIISCSVFLIFMFIDTSSIAVPQEEMKYKQSVVIETPEIIEGEEDEPIAKSTKNYKEFTFKEYETWEAVMVQD